MKQIILIFCLGFILNSCAKEQSTAYDTNANVVFNLKTSGSISRNNSPDYQSSTDDLNEITILVFEGDGSNNYLYRRSGITPVNNKFTAEILLTNDPVIIHIFANPNDKVNSTNYNGQTESQVIGSLTTELNLNDGVNSFPMHSSLSLPNIIEDITVNSDVYLLRAMALADINSSDIAENIFTLKGASVYHTPNTGRWVSDYRINENGNPATPIVTAPTIPTFTTTVATPSTTPTISGNKMESQLFIYENSTTSSPNSRIVVSGIYNSNGVTTYYPIDFTDSNGASINILRNHQYVINIKAITGSGYTNVIDAANGESIDIVADIIDWNSIVIDGSIDPEVVFNAPSKVLLDHISNNGSYVRTVTYNSNKDVKLFLDGIEVLFPTGGATSVDLTIPTEQGNWLTSATWNPTNNLEGSFEFTHSTSNYSNAISYILTLKSGGITRNMEVFVNSSVSLEPQSNCYIVPLGGKVLNLPAVDHANSFWDTTGDGNDPAYVINSTDEWYAEVIWADFDFNDKVTIENDGTSGFGIGNEGLGITIGALTKPGNVIIGLKKKGANSGVTDYVWSWHLWITDYDPNIRTDSKAWSLNEFYNTTGGQVHSYSDISGTTFWSGDYSGAVVMDRNLGAIASAGSDGGAIDNTAGIDAFGMQYQWGRKDPFPYAQNIDNATTTTWGRVTTSMWPNAAAGPFNKPYSVRNPHQFITTAISEDWQDPRDDNSWRYLKGEKSFYDPCPDGWKVAPKDMLSNFNTTVPVEAEGTINHGRSYTEGGNIAAWYPATGFLLDIDGIQGYAGIYGVYWTSTQVGDYSWMMYFVSTYLFPETSVNRAFGFVVRCLKE